MSNQDLRKQIQQTIQDNFPHIIISVVIMMIASAILTLPLVLLLYFSVGDTPAVTDFPAATVAISLVIGYLSMLVSVFLTYGLSVLLGRFYRKERAVIGHLFWGIRDMKRLSLIPLLLYIIILAVSLLFAFGCTYLMEIEAPEQIITMVLIPVVLVIMLVIFPYLYTFCIMYESPKLSFWAVLKQSRRMLKKKKWSLFCFCLSMIRLPLAVMFVSAIMLVTVGVGALPCRIAFYFILIYLLLAWNALYYRQMEPAVEETQQLPDLSGITVEDADQ